MAMRTAMSALILALAAGLVSAKPSTSPWKQDQLTESYMRSLTNHQCMLKTIASLQSGCSTEQCLKTQAGISGDCITWAKGDLVDFCNAFDREYIARYCATNELNARQCLVIHSAKQVQYNSIASPAR